MTRTFHRTLPLAGLLGLLLILSLAAGCQRIAPIRTLPSWVRGVYIPVFKNETYEPQLEETATRLTQEAFLADGRVDVVPKEQADLVLQVTLMDWTAETVRTRGDYIGRTDEILLTYGIKLYDPFDMEHPMADLGRFRISTAFNIDIRSNRYEPEPDRKERLMRQLSEQILLRVINGFPASAAGIAPGSTVPQFRTPESIPMEDPLQPRPEQESGPVTSTPTESHSH